MPNAYASAFKIPLKNLPLFGKQFEHQVHKAIEAKRNIMQFVTKSPRVLGGVYMGDKVAQRRPIVLCHPCTFKYLHWWRREHYRGDWGWKYTGDCDGCGMRGVDADFFAPDEKFYSILAENHGLNPNPHK